MTLHTELPITGNGSGLFAWFAGLFRRPVPHVTVNTYSVKRIDAKALRDAKHKQLEDELPLPFELRQRLARLRRKAVA